MAKATTYETKKLSLSVDVVLRPSESAWQGDETVRVDTVRVDVPYDPRAHADSLKALAASAHAALDAALAVAHAGFAEAAATHTKAEAERRAKWEAEAEARRIEREAKAAEATA